MSAKRNRIMQPLLYLTVLLVIVMVIGFFAYFTNGFSEDYKGFYITVNGERVLSAKGGLCLEAGTPVEVEVKYALASVGDKKTGYSVRIVPNAKYDFDFTLDGEAMSFGSIEDFTTAFVITKEESSFRIETKGSLQKTLEALFPGKTVEFDAFGLEEKDMFTMEITSYNEKDTVLVHFRVLRGDLEVTVDPGVIVF